MYLCIYVQVDRDRLNKQVEIYMIIMKIECTIPGETSLLEFAPFIKFIISHKQRQIGHIFI